MKNPIRLKVLLMRSDEGWTGLVLDVNVAFQFDLLTNLKSKLIEAVSDNLAAYHEVGYGPDDALPKAPQKYWDLYDKGVPLEKYVDGVVAGILGREWPVSDAFDVDDRDACVYEQRELTLV